MSEKKSTDDRSRRLGSSGKARQRGIEEWRFRVRVRLVSIEGEVDLILSQTEFRCLADANGDILRQLRPANIINHLHVLAPYGRSKSTHPTELSRPHLHPSFTLTSPLNPNPNPNPNSTRIRDPTLTLALTVTLKPNSNPTQFLLQTPEPRTPRTCHRALTHTKTL